MGHHNKVAGVLFKNPKLYKALLSTDERSGEILWESWVVGFKQATNLRPDAWQRLIDADNSAATAIRCLSRLIDIAFGQRRISQEERDYVTKSAPKDIARWVVALNRWRYEAAQGIPTLVDISRL